MAYQNTTNQYQESRYIVTIGVAPYPTIQSAIDAANTAGIPATILVRAGVYTENLTLYDGIELQGTYSNQAVIIGTHTPPSSGTCTFTSLGLSSVGVNGHVLTSNAVGTAEINFTLCEFNIFDGYICNLPNWTGSINLALCKDLSSVDNGVVNNASTSTIYIANCSFLAGGTKSLLSSGVLNISNTEISNPVVLSGSGRSTFSGGSTNSQPLTLSGTAILDVLNGMITTDTRTSITLGLGTRINLYDACVYTTNAIAISGTGTAGIYNTTFGSSYALAAGVITIYSGAVMNAVNQMTAATVSSFTTAGIVTNAATGILSSLTNGTDNYILTVDPATHLPSWQIPIAGGITWTRETSASVSAVINHGYINTNVGLTTITLPATAALGTIIAVMGESAAGWKISTGALQNIQFGSLSTTPGATGYLASTNQFDVVYLLCRVADTTWSVIQSQGNIAIA